MSRHSFSSMPKAPLQHQLPSTDLHFCTRDQAIRKLTLFLEEHRKKAAPGKPVWVTVITGSGKHSPNGPILREAVEKLLQKREMVYRINPGKGSFTVDANSGCLLWKSPAPTDTKLRVLPGDVEEVRVLQAHLQRQQRRHSASLAATTLHRGSSSSTTLSSAVVFPSNDEPRPAEVAASDQELRQAQECSLDDQRRQQKQLTRERKLLQRVLQASVELHQDEQQEEEQELRKALQESLQQEQEFQRREEQQLQRALSLSALDDNNERQRLEEQQRNEQELLQQALERSLQLDQDSADLQQAMENTQQSVDEEQEQLQLALRLSLTQL